jgi:hypothetical protein
MKLVTDLQLGGRRNLFGDRLRAKDPELAARAALTRRTASDPAAAAWCRELTPAEANLVVADLASGKVRLT